MRCPHCQQIVLRSHCNSTHCAWANCMECFVTVDTDGHHFHYRPPKAKPGDEWWTCPFEAVA